MNCLILLVIFLAIIVLVRLMKIVDLAGELRGHVEEEVTHADNQFNAFFFILFMLFLFGITVIPTYMYRNYMMTPPASEHGQSIDNLMYFTFAVIGIAFFITQTLLFVFAYKYHAKKDTKAFYYPHNNKLELIWTIVPSIVLTAMIIYGLSVWKNVMMDAPAEKPIVIELFSKQFKWIARYAGTDNELGSFSYKKIIGVNELGIDSSDTRSNDDIIVSGEFHLPVNRQVEFHLRSQDVLHGAFMPYFRLQMNTVPGMTTMLKFKPIITTNDMRGIMKDDKFDYLLLCNKICGSSHYNMQMNIVVDTEADFNNWIKEQKTFKSEEATKAEITKTDSVKVTAVLEAVKIEKK